MQVEIFNHDGNQINIMYSKKQSISKILIKNDRDFRSVGPKVFNILIYNRVQCTQVYNLYIYSNVLIKIPSVFDQPTTCGHSYRCLLNFLTVKNSKISVFKKKKNNYYYKKIRRTIQNVQYRCKCACFERRVLLHFGACQY